jgi:hypothetical protein
MNADVAVRAALQQHALISLSFALQRGNAIISIKGLSLLRLRLARRQNRHVTFELIIGMFFLKHFFLPHLL